MATITTDEYGSQVEVANKRTNVSSRKASTHKEDAKFSKVKSQTSGSTFYTGSLAGSSGFIVQEAAAGEMFITPVDGDSIDAAAFTLKTLYEIGVKQVSGSGGIVHVVY